MSSQIGTLQPKARTAQSMWPVAILALLVVAMIAVIVTTQEGSLPREETTSLRSTPANTPTELSGGIAQSIVGAPVSTGVAATHGKQLGIEIAFPQAFAGTVVNTPTELTGGIAFSTAGAVTSAPVELSGRFLAERAKQLGTEIGAKADRGGSGGELCEICWKYR